MTNDHEIMIDQTTALIRIADALQDLLEIVAPLKGVLEQALAEAKRDAGL